MAKRRGNGEGSITKRKSDGRWQGYVTVGYDVETGKPKKKYFYGKTRKEVQELVNEALGKVQAGTYREPSKLTMAEWLTTWLNDYMRPSLRPTTWENYEIQVRRHILPALGHLRLSQLQTSNLQKLYNDKLSNGGRLDGKEGGLSPRTVRYIHTLIHAALEQAKKEGMITINVADAVKLPHDPKKEIQCLDTEGVKRFLAAARETKHFPAYFLALNTGLRRGELLGLRWKDVDLKAGSITVNQGLVRTKQGLVLQEPKTKLSNRTIGISPQVVSVLKEHKKRQNEERLAAGTAYNTKNHLVFCNELGEPLCPRGFTRHFERVLKRAGLEGKVTFHGLRHTFATLSLQEGAAARTVQEALGHHKAAFTLDVYSSVTAKMKKEATDRIGSLLASCLNE
ncbi:MAG: site-specific integrase [Firmicutes bacterium]|nr:site-specific integrase [Bacillota bacterium]